MADIRRFLGSSAHSGQKVEIYFIAPKVGTGVLTEVSAYRLAMTVDVGGQHTLVVEINEGSRGKDAGTCTIIFDGKRQVDATFKVSSYWIDLTTNVLPISGRYAIWRNGAATDFTTPAPFRPKGWTVPAQAAVADLAYDPRLTGPEPEAA